jgi:hypothetical protein
MARKARAIVNDGQKMTVPDLRFVSRAAWQARNGGALRIVTPDAASAQAENFDTPG